MKITITLYCSVMLLVALVSSAFSFSFSEYDAREQQEEQKTASLRQGDVTPACSPALQKKRIALLIGQQQHMGPFLVQQSRYSPFYKEINRKLHRLGLETYTQEAIDNQIAEAELQALLNNDPDAALAASRHLGADFFIRGIISSRTGTNPLLDVQEVYATMDFTLTDSAGNIISTQSISSESYSNTDIIGTLQRLVEKNSTRIVTALYNDYCTKAVSGNSTGARQKNTATSQTGKVSSAGTGKTSGPPAVLATTDRIKKTAEQVVVKTLIVSAEGIADPEAETYKKDKGLMIDALRADARRQAIEKVVGTYVDSATLVENFMLINDRVLTQSRGLIKKIIKETPPWLGKDGLMHIMIKAEVYLSGVREALQTMSRSERLNLIKESGNPTISVAILIKDAGRNSSTPSQQSDIAENILKEEFKKFGYRVWSEQYGRMLKGDYGAGRSRKEADFSVIGEVKFETKDIFLKASGNSLTRHILTSWTVKCMNNHTGEEIYFNNKIPRKKTWDSEDAALADIGTMIGREFSADFFKDHLMQTSTIYQLELTGNTPIEYSTALLLKKEFIGLRPILNVELRDFSEGSQTVYEVEFAGKAQHFSQILHESVLRPLNAKLGKGVFRLTSHHGNVVRIALTTREDTTALNRRLETGPPASLATAAPERVKELINNTEMLQDIESVNPYMHGGKTQGTGRDAESVIRNF